jgi:hypothetical protein
LFLATFQRLLAILNQAHECIQCSAFDASSKYETISPVPHIFCCYHSI